MYIHTYTCFIFICLFVCAHVNTQYIVVYAENPPVQEHQEATADEKGDRSGSVVVPQG